MNAKGHDEAKYLLRKLLTQHGEELAGTHPWVWEFDRWKELVFALLAQVAQAPEEELRKVVEDLAELDLLEISALAGLAGDQGEPEADSESARRILELLAERGFDPATAQRAFKTIAQAAEGLHEHFGGKVQRYLRSYGSRMLEELDDVFQLDALQEDEAMQGFSYWLQNVMNMPLSLRDETLQRFCKEHGLTPDQLIEAADELDFNLGLVDDLIQISIVSAQEQQTQATE